MIGKAIESALLQDYPELEVVISDNCSTDNSDEVIRKYTSDPRVKYFRNETNLGMLGNFRKATFEYAQGELITYVSSDDYLSDQGFISDAVQLFSGESGLSLVFGKMAVLNLNSGRQWVYPEKPFFERKIWDGMDVFKGYENLPLFSCCGCLMKRENLKIINAYERDYIGFDIEHNYKMMVLGKVGFINRPCYIMTGHDDNSTFPKKATRLLDGYKAYEEVEAFVTQRMPEFKQEARIWKEHSLFALMNWGFHLMSGKGGAEYVLYKKETKSRYPHLYSRYVNSKKYKRMVMVNLIRKIKRGLGIGN